MIYNAYRVATILAQPVLKVIAHRRLKNKKEIKSRINERFGITKTARPNGKIVWIHGASNGEILSILPLIEYLKSLPSAPHILITTMTVTAAQLLEKRLQSHDYIHQFIPYDTPKWVESFHDHWKPDMAIWVESELWPNHLSALKNHNVPSALLNARLSEKSAGKWRSFQKTFTSITSCFETILAQSTGDLDRLMSLGIGRVRYAGNLKDISPALPFDPVAADDIRAVIETRTTLLFASTHDPEEKMIAAAHQKLKSDHPDLLSIIVPRHPKRGEAIAHELNGNGLSVALRSLKMSPRMNTDIYVADTLGEIGMFYHLCPIVYVGNSIDTTPGGGHNLLEPAWHGCAIISGDSLFNFTDQANAMSESGAVNIVSSPDELINAAHDLLINTDKAQNMTNNAYNYVEVKQASGLDKIIDHVEQTCQRAGLL